MLTGPPLKFHGTRDILGAGLCGVWSSEAADIVALDIYQRCDESGERISLGVGERRLAELAAHPPDHCGLCARWS
jgi:hypothetical protein